MPAHLSSILQRPAARQVIFIVVLSLGSMLAATYGVLGYYAIERQKTSGQVFFNDVVNDLNHKINNYENNFDETELVNSPFIARYSIIIFEPDGSTVSITGTPDNIAHLPNWSFADRASSHILYKLEGFEAWQKLDHGYRLYMDVTYQPLLTNFASPLYAIPVLLAVVIMLLCLVQLRKRYEAWDTLLDYTQNLQQTSKIAYHPLQLNESHFNPELQHLAQVINRFAFKITQASTQLKELNYRQRMLVDNAPLPLFLMNRKGRLLYFNDRFAHLFGTPFDKNVVFMLSDFFTGSDKLTQQLLSSISDNSIFVTLSVTNLQRDSYFDLHLNPYYNQLGKLHGFTGSLEVVTDYHNQLQQAWLNKKQQTEKLASFDKVWAVLGHELRTPLSGMIGMIDLLNEDSSQLNADQQETLTTLQQSSHTMLQLLNDMLDVAKMNAGKLQSNISNVDVLQMLRQVADLMVGNARRQHISLYLHADPNAPRYIESDDGRLRQILLNLMSNAIKFTKQGYVAIILDKLTNQHPIIQNRPNINLEIPDWIRITVKDSGIGISEKEQKKLFSYFNQANDSISRQFGGTGLGLAISNNFSHLLGGFIHLDSQVGEGSEFQVYLPLEKFSVQPVFNFKTGDLPIFLVIISPYKVNQYFARVLNALEIPSTIITDVDESMVSRINRIKFLDLKPIFVVDDAGYDKALFNQIEAFPDAIKIIVSIENERSIDQNIMADFDGLIQKPLITSTFFAELARLYHAKYDQDKPQTPRLSPQAAFISFLQRQQLTSLPQPPSSTPLHDGYLDSAAPNHTLVASDHDNVTMNDKAILVAEDNPVNQKIAKKHLTNLGYQVIMAGDGEQAIQLLAAHRHEIGLVLMDCRMPILDGLAATRQIRAKKDSIPIIALTANDTDEDKKDCIEAGMNGFLTKPLSKTQIQNLLNRYML